MLLVKLNGVKKSYIFILKALKNMDGQTETNFTLDPPYYGNICLS